METTAIDQQKTKSSFVAFLAWIFIVLAGFETMMAVMMVFSPLMALGFSVLFGWIIKRLLSTGIKAEFL